VARPEDLALPTLRERYEALLLKALALRATVPKNVNVLMHMMGYVKRQASADEKAEMAEALERYRAGLAPLLVPLTLVAHHVRRRQVQYLAGQSYLDPHPVELKLRNHA
jgi:uncharacterized protein YbgA (DUF1722 family)